MTDSRIKLLLVDDENEIIRALQRSLRKDYEIEATTSAFKALELLEQSEFDVLVSDVRMMEMDGLELLALCQQKHPLVGRIALTGYADMEACQQAIENKTAQLIISKPWETFELKNLINLVAELQQTKAAYESLKQFSGGG